MMFKHLKEQNPFNFIEFYYENCDKNKNYSIVTKCKYEFKNASNPCIITKRREEKRREEKRTFLRNYFLVHVLIII